MLSRGGIAQFDRAHAKARQSQLLRALGVRSWREAMAKGVAAICVENSDALVAVVPTRNGGFASKDRGFHALTNKTQSTGLGCGVVGHRVARSAFALRVGWNSARFSDYGLAHLCGKAKC